MLLGGCGDDDDSATPASESSEAEGRVTSVDGSFEIIDAASGSTTPGTSCSGEGVFDDINSSTHVVLHDSSGDVLARTTLGPGRTLGPTECGFKFCFESVPEGADEYVVVVGDHGEASYTFDELKQRGITLTVGGRHAGARELS